MQDLAQHLVELADVQAASPVVMMQPGLRLRAPFYAVLAESLQAAAGRDVHFEFIADLEGWTSGVQRLALRRLAGQVDSITAPGVETSLTSIISRPAGTQRPLVVGVACGDAQLPPWAEAVHVCTRPTKSTDFQLVVA